MTNASVELQKAHLTTIEHSTLQQKIKEDSKRKKTSRRSIHKGGSAPSVDELREKIRIRQETEKTLDLSRAQRAMTTALNKAKEALRVLRDRLGRIIGQGKND